MKGEHRRVMIKTGMNLPKPKGIVLNTIAVYCRIHSQLNAHNQNALGIGHLYIVDFWQFE